MFKQIEGYDYYDDKTTGQRMAVSLSSGEVTKSVVLEVPEGSIFYTPEQQEAYKERKQLEKERRMKAAIFTMQNSDLGNFYFVSKEREYDSISPATLARLIYLCTFLRYDNGVLFVSNRTPMSVSDLTEVLNLSRNSITDFLNEANKYLSVLDDGRLSIEKDTFCKGALSEKKHISFQKVYVDTVRILYRATPRNKHRYLGYIFFMLPYVNIEHNILCFNPEEKDLERVRALTLLDFCQAINYDVNHAARLRREYANISFTINGSEEKFCSFVCDGGSPNNSKIYVNPHVLYSGSDYAHVEVLGAFCKSA